MIQFLQCGNALLVHALAPLFLDILFKIARQRCRNRYTLAGEKLRHVFIAGLTQNREVAAIDHSHASSPSLRHQIFEMLINFRGTTGEIQSFYGVCAQILQHEIDSGAVHLLGARGPGIDVTVSTTEVTGVAEIHLQGIQYLAGYRRKISLDQ